MLAQYFNYPRLVCAKTLRKALGSRLWEISFDQLGDFAHWPKKEALFCGETERNEKKKRLISRTLCLKKEVNCQLHFGSVHSLDAWRKSLVVSIWFVHSLQEFLLSVKYSCFLFTEKCLFLQVFWLDFDVWSRRVMGNCFGDLPSNRSFRSSSRPRGCVGGLCKQRETLLGWIDQKKLSV